MSRYDLRVPRPHRCFADHPEGGMRQETNRSPRKRRCQARATFKPGDDPPCPRCGSTAHWRLEAKHRKKDRERETCRDPACPIMHPHSVYSAECVHHPLLGNDLTGEHRARPTEECPF